MRNERRRLVAAWLVPLALALGACSVANTDADSPGSCTLTCSNPIVPDASFKIVPLFDVATFEMSCEADFGAAGTNIAPLNGPIQVKYFIYKEAQEGTFNGGGGAGGGVEALQDEGTMHQIPVPNIGFEPYVVGAMAAEKTHPEHREGEGKDVVITPFKFAGVVTPKSEWCSDSCGVMTYEVWPVCIQAKENKVTAGVVSGGIRSEPITFTISNDSDE